MDRTVTIDWLLKNYCTFLSTITILQSKVNCLKPILIIDVVKEEQQREKYIFNYLEFTYVVLSLLFLDVLVLRYLN